MIQTQIIGQLANIDNSKTYWVKIGDTGQEIEIGTPTLDGKEVYFSGSEPIVLSSDMTDTFENVYIRSCTINLTSNFDLREYVVAENYNDIHVVIRYNDASGDIIFDGYVIPLQYNQQYTYNYNEFSIECVDRLGILEYIKFQPLLNSNFNYRKPKEFIELALNNIGFIIDDEHPENTNLTYIDIAGLHIADTTINPIIFIGESEDDWMDCKEVLEEIGKIYGCFFYQDGNTCIVENVLRFTLGSSIPVTKKMYRGADTNISVQETYNRIECSVDLSNIDDTFIDPFDDDNFEPTTNYGERVLTEIMVKNKDEEFDNIRTFKNLIDMAARPTSPIINWSSGYVDMEGESEIYDTYCQVMKNKIFDFGDVNYLNDTVGQTVISGVNIDPVANTIDNEIVPIKRDAWKVLKWLYYNPGKGAFLSFGKTNDLINKKDKQVPQLKDMKTALYIQVNGADRSSIISGSTPAQYNVTYNANVTGYLDNLFNTNQPVCKFEIGNSNNITPYDVSSKNYFVLSGKITLNPIVPKTGAAFYGGNDDTWFFDSPYNTFLRNLNDVNTVYNWYQSHWRDNVWAKNVLFFNHVVCQGNDEEKKKDGYYYQNYTWTNYWNDVSYMPDNWPYNQTPERSFRGMCLPMLSAKYDNFEFTKSIYTGHGSGSGEHEPAEIDNLHQFPVLACEMKIGDYYLIEDFEVTKMANWGINEDILERMYVWKKIEECPVVDGVTQTWFTIPIDPGIGDKILGKEFDIRNTVTLQSGIKATGLAIPIPYKSGLNGAVTFKILGPYNAAWHDREWHGGWWPFNYIYFLADYIPLMAYVENIILSDFKIELYEGNSNNKKKGDKDLVYVKEVNAPHKEEQSFDVKFCTSLRTSEIPDDVEYKPNNSAIMDENGLPWYGMTYDGHSGVKLEEARVSELFNILSRPRKIVETTLKLVNPEKTYLKNNYTFEYFTYPNNSLQIYRTLARTIDLKLDNMTCTMKEISNEPS